MGHTCRQRQQQYILPTSGNMTMGRQYRNKHRTQHRIQTKQQQLLLLLLQCTKIALYLTASTATQLSPHPNIISRLAACQSEPISTTTMQAACTIITSGLEWVFVWCSQPTLPAGPNSTCFDLLEKCIQHAVSCPTSAQVLQQIEAVEFGPYRVFTRSSQHRAASSTFYGNQHANQDLGGRAGCNWKAYITRDQLWAKSLGLGLHLSQGVGLQQACLSQLDVCSTRYQSVGLA